MLLVLCVVVVCGKHKQQHRHELVGVTKMVANARSHIYSLTARLGRKLLSGVRQRRRATVSNHVRFGVTIPPA